MPDDFFFRWWFVAIFVTAFLMSAWFRYQARQKGGTIPRKVERGTVLAMRVVFAAGLYLGILAYMIHPPWMSWSSFAAPRWSRWLGVAVAALMVPTLYWILNSIGPNISETVLTKYSHRLVTRGPYRWVRHPLYVAASTMFLALGLAAANWYLIGISAIALAGLAMYVVPQEERELEKRFGSAYRQYKQRTGGLFPRLR
jgi:protein-S-isoprenylcysteine O-methyltransferase Ste14